MILLPLPTLTQGVGLWYMIFLHRTGYLLQFLGNKVFQIFFEIEPTFMGLNGLQTWLSCRDLHILCISYWKSFSVHWPLLHPCGAGIAKHGFCIQFWIFNTIPCQNLLVNWSPFLPYEESWWEKIKFCVQIWTFYVLSIKIIFSEMTTNPFPMGSYVTEPELCVVLYVKSSFQQRYCSELGPSLTFWLKKKNPCHCWKSQSPLNHWRENLFLVTFFYKISINSLRGDISLECKYFN